MSTLGATQPVPAEDVPADLPAAEPAEAEVTAGEQEATPASDDPNAILAAEIAARVEEVSHEIDADLEGFAQAEAAFLIEADADISAARQSSATYATVAAQGIRGRLEDAGDIIRAMCARYGRRAAA